MSQLALRGPRSSTITARVLDNMVVLIFLALALALTIASPLFLTPDNLLNIVRQVAVIVIISVAFTLVLGSGEIDLSVGAVMGLTGVFMAQMMLAGLPPTVAVVIGIVIGAGCGFINAALITLFNLNALITTLATAGIFRGVIFIVTNTRPVNGLPEEFLALGQGNVWGIPIPIFVMLGAIVLIFILINRTVFGRHAIAVGGNRDAAIVTGISLARVRFTVYGMMGAAAALAGAVQTSRSASAQISAGDGIELDAIAAVVIGGTSLWGGNARIIGTVFGCLIVGMVANGLNLLAINANWQVVAKGALILVAIILDAVSSGLIARLTKRRRAAVDEPDGGVGTTPIEPDRSPASTAGAGR